MNSPYDLRWQCNLGIYIAGIIILLYNFYMVYWLDRLFSESGINGRINSLEYLNDGVNFNTNVFKEKSHSFLIRQVFLQSV